MSRASKLTLLGTSVFAASTIILVHFQQESERKVRATDDLPVYYVYCCCCRVL